MAFLRGTFDCQKNLFDQPPVDERILAAIRSFGFLNIDHGPWVAGGAVRRVFAKQPYGGDIDVFLPKEGAFSGDRVEVMLANRFDTRCETLTGNVTEFLILNERKWREDYNKALQNDESSRLSLTKPHFAHKVQVIKTSTFATVEELLLDFDFTVCMVATDGWNWVADERFFTDLEQQRLVINNFEQRKNRRNRLAKYCRNGFDPGPGVFEHILGTDKDGILGLDEKGFFAEAVDGDSSI